MLYVFLSSQVRPPPASLTHARTRTHIYTDTAETSADGHEYLSAWSDLGQREGREKYLRSLVAVVVSCVFQDRVGRWLVVPLALVFSPFDDRMRDFG